jgi:AcrR family transcriptional regulator
MEPWFHLYYPELWFRLSRPPKVSRMRADAERNKKLIVQAAREVFATAGLAAPIDEIAQRAGVGTGTLYRHFPTKEALFEAVVIGRVEDLVEEARRLIARNDPKTAFFQLLSQLVQHGEGHKDLMDALGKQSFDIQKAVPGLLAEMWSASRTGPASGDCSPRRRASARAGAGQCGVRGYRPTRRWRRAHLDGHQRRPPSEGREA